MSSSSFIQAEDQSKANTTDNSQVHSEQERLNLEQTLSSIQTVESTTTQKIRAVLATAWDQCKEGAIEGTGNSIVEAICKKFTDTLGAESARSLGEGAAKIALGRREEGIEQCVNAGMALAFRMTELVKAIEAGQLPQELIKQEIQNEVLDAIKSSEIAKPR